MSQAALPPSLARLLSQGALFEDKYRLVKSIGQGSFASVIHARHETMDRDVALKVLRPDVIEEHPDVGQRFLTEGRLASRLTSPHTVMVFDFGETEEGTPFMVLEYVDGRPLDYAMEKHGALGLKRSIRITIQILESLEEAHEHNIIHRDLKPANVMVGKGMKKQKEGVHIKVLDFGVAKLVDETEDDVDMNKEPDGRHSTQFIGTPRYMSPEQILGREVSPASDLYSLGLIFFEMCTGKPSVPGDNVAKVAQTHLAEEPLELAGIDELPSVLQDIILTATARYPDDRYEQAADFSRALQQALKKGRKQNKRARAPATVQQSDDEPKKSEEISKRRSDVFSGEGYVEVPDEDDVATSPKRTSSTGPRPGSRPPSSSSSARSSSRPPSARSKTGTRKASSTPGASTNRRTDSQNDSPPPSQEGGDLELDMESVHRQRRDAARAGRSRREFADKAAAGDGADVRRWAASSAIVAISGYAGFVVVGGALSMFGAPMRSMLAVFPVGLALLWAVFSESAYPDTARRVMIPWAKRTVTMTLVAVVVLAVVMPAEAAEGLREDSLWFMHSWPDIARMGWLEGLTEAICGSMAWLMELIQRLIPWSQ